MKTSLRFYGIEKNVLESEDFKARISAGAYCEKIIKNNYVQFSGDFLYLDPSPSLNLRNCLSGPLMIYLCGISQRVSFFMDLPRKHLPKKLQSLKKFKIDYLNVDILGKGGWDESTSPASYITHNPELTFISSSADYENLWQAVRMFFPKSPTSCPAAQILLNNYLKKLGFFKKTIIILGL